MPRGAAFKAQRLDGAPEQCAWLQHILLDYTLVIIQKVMIFLQRQVLEDVEPQGFSPTAGGDANGAASLEGSWAVS